MHTQHQSAPAEQVEHASAYIELQATWGITPCCLAETIGCRVGGVDISARMIGWAQRQVRRAATVDRVTLGVADAQRLPFADGTFDAVICEAVTAFVPDKLRGGRISETGQRCRKKVQ